MLRLTILFLFAVVFSGSVWAKKAVRNTEPRCKSVFCTATVLNMDGPGDDPRTLKAKQIDKVMRKRTKGFEPCIVLARRRNAFLKNVEIEFVISGKGKVIASRVNGKQKSSLAKCIHTPLSRIRFPSVGRRRSIATFNMKLVQ
jgi:hypothetical protein